MYEVIPSGVAAIGASIACGGAVLLFSIAIRRTLRTHRLGDLLCSEKSSKSSAGAFDGLRSYLAVHRAKAAAPHGYSVEQLTTLSLLISFGATLFFGLIGASLLGPFGLVALLIGLPLGPLFIGGWLKGVAEHRLRAFQLRIPYVMDLIVLCLRSGTSLHVALNRVAQDYAGHPVGDEFGQVLLEINLGVPRSQAFRHLVDRVPDLETRELIDTITQAEELGWPLADAIEQLADRLNSQRVVKAQDTAGVAGAMVMLPSALVMASAVLLLFGPTIVRLLREGINLQ